MCTCIVIEVQRSHVKSRESVRLLKKKEVPRANQANKEYYAASLVVIQLCGKFLYWR